MNILEGHRASYHRVKTIKGDDAIEAEIAAHIPDPIALIQHDDVLAWINEPHRVDRKIKPILDRAATLIQPGATVLDAGCYGGYAFDYFANKLPFEFRYVGVDICEAAVIAARQAHSSENARFVFGNVFDMAGQYDLAICLRVVIHTGQLGRLMKSLAYAAPQALIGMTIDEDIGYLVDEEMSGRQFIYRHHSPETVARCADAAGVSFEIYRDAPFQTVHIRRV